eukprot:m.315493 g.315493  ORF g.315493 m.315493 type:complete len:399 (+) comp27522_c1_seq9:297-1493(+)
MASSRPSSISPRSTMASPRRPSSISPSPQSTIAWFRRNNAAFAIQVVIGMCLVGLLGSAMLGARTNSARAPRSRPRSSTATRIGLRSSGRSFDAPDRPSNSQTQGNAAESRLDWGLHLALKEANAYRGNTDPVDTGGPLVTFLVTANVIPTIPSTCMIDQTLDSIPKGSIIIVVLDKYTPTKHGNTTTDEYDEFQARIKARPDVELVARRPRDSSGKSLVGLLRFGIQLVKTPYVVAVQADMPFKYPEQLNFTNIALDMARYPELKYISFNFWSDNSVQRDRVMHGDQHKPSIDRIVGDEMTSAATNLTYMRTTMWTDNNYVCRTKYLTSMVSVESAANVPFPEWVMKSSIITDVNADVANASQFLWRRYGTWHYGGVDFPKQLLHLEGRKTKAIDCK